MRTLHRLSLLALLATASATTPLAAQAPASVAHLSPSAADSLFDAGMQEGATAARAVGTTLWTVGGFAGGAVLGPIGVSLAHALAGGAASALPATTATRLGKKEADYQLGYQQAYSEQLAARRKASARMGGVAGTALLAIGAAVYFAM